MRFYGKKGYRKRAGRRSTRKPYAKRSRAITKVVKKVLSRNLEKKAFHFALANEALTIATPSLVPKAIDLVPALAQGTGASQRIGNEILVKNAYIKGFVNIKAYNATTNPNAVPIYVKFWLLSCKKTNTPAMATISTFSTFFESMNSGLPFQGSTLDMLLTVNKDVWTVHSTKLVKIGVSTSVGGNNPVATTGYFDNSQMSKPFYFNYTKHLKKIMYDDTVNNVSTNRNLFLVIQPANADGTTTVDPTIIINPAEIHTVQLVEYTDA